MPTSGVDPREPHEILFPFQREIVKWAVRKGRAAIFADCGLGKTFMQLEWARQMGERTLIVAPLAVSKQTITEAARVGIGVRYAKEPDREPGITITNYQRLRSFVGADYDAIVLDESSILKSLDGKTRRMLLSDFGDTPHRLCCTATPSPNDLTELGNHAQFLGVMSWREMSATFFVKESNGQSWRLKGHAREAFFRWLATWSVYIRRPSDIGFDDDGFVLPTLQITADVVECNDRPAAGRLFQSPKGIQGRLAVRKATQAERVARTMEMINENSDQWIVWCGLNTEGRLLHKALNGESVLVEGSQTEDQKMDAAARWLAGNVRVMITKPSIFGFGMNFQHCHRMAFLGLSDSYEQYYQAIRRCWRFGQESPVTARVVVSDLETHVVGNVERKERDAARLAEGIASAMSEYKKEELSGAAQNYTEAREWHNGKGWRLGLGDSAEMLADVADGSVGMSVFSPPFVSLYTYTATERDLGNCRDEATFFNQFSFIIQELLRTTAAGRLCCVHVSQVPAMLVRDDYIGIKDFRAQCVAAFESGGWVYHGECVIDKDPQAQAIRTKSKGLLFTQLRKDASWLRPALADYILVFRKPGENAEPIHPDVTNEDWISWARPIWYGIRESDTLQYRLARSDKDERHICPLQLGVIERCIRLWSNPDDLVCSPFAGIGSEGYMALRLGRQFVGVELKPEYHKIAVQNLEHAAKTTDRLF